MAQMEVVSEQIKNRVQPDCVIYELRQCLYTLGVQQLASELCLRGADFAMRQR